MSAVAAVGGANGSIAAQGSPGEAKSLVEATLTENAKMAQWYQAPLRIPDTATMFPMGGNVNMKA